MDLVSHPSLRSLHPTGLHPETERRIAVLHGALPFVTCEAATGQDILRCHSVEHVERIRRTQGMLTLDTLCSESTLEAGLVAAGAAIEAVRCGGFALGRPPGHHADRDRAAGFCIFNSIVVAARFAQAELGVGRVAILDWDVHHGNGTQALVAGDPSVLYVSLHQWPFYPWTTGGPDDQSDLRLNIPLAAGTGDAAYLDAFEAAEAAIGAFEPELLLVSAGFDAHVDDPLGGLTLGDATFHELAGRAARLAPRYAAVLEGGYNLETLPRLVRTAQEGFEG